MHELVTLTELNFKRYNDIDDIPEMSGLYRIYNTVDMIFYIGRSKNVKKRLSDHFKGKTHTKKISEYFKYVDICEVEDPSLLAMYEIYYINLHKPMGNIKDKYREKPVEKQVRRTKVIEEVKDIDVIVSFFKKNRNTRVNTYTLQHVCDKFDLKVNIESDAKLRQMLYEKGIRFDGRNYIMAS